MRITDPEIKHLIHLALSEDIGSGDVTSELLLGSQPSGQAVIVAKQEGVLAGLPVARMVFRTVNPRVVFRMLKRDGERIRKGEKVALVRGKIQGILSAERTALNLLQRLSGVASLTASYVEKVKGTKTKILDTRKTTPGLRVLEKYAVKTGGGENHRMGLFDMILIKENHIKAVGGMSKAIMRARSEPRKEKVEVEVRNLSEVREAVESKPDWIMLDNMRSHQMRKAVRMIRSVSRAVKIEASGSVNLKNVRKIALTGVDFISVGALTHSAPALDMSLTLSEPQAQI
ncbi:MAG: carboxylating nicotinate-nucleotide diphosphorylase [Candidatus Zixiibacteriota bacterium]|nr:MAG: carboxylating nicotinate-nucleotide diphosphorylase [candidate division Zixibacteria bacterium]